MKFKEFQTFALNFKSRRKWLFGKNRSETFFLPLKEIARHLQEKELLRLERARQRHIERQQKEEEGEGKMLSEALSKLKANVNHCEVAELQTGQSNSSNQESSQTTL